MRKPYDRDGISKLVKKVTVNYAHFIRDKVKEEGSVYRPLGIDDSFMEYMQLFIAVVRKQFNIETGNEHVYPAVVLREAGDVVKNTIVQEGYEDSLKDTRFVNFVFRLSILLLEVWETEVYGTNHLKQAQVV